MATKYAGVDLSYANASVDYKALKAGTINGYKVKFAMLRLGHGTKKDTLFDKHYKGCKEAGIYVGVYHWTYATNLAEARAEADWAIRELANYDIDYPIALDFEDNSVLGAGLTKAQYTAICKAYMDRIKAANYYPMLYCNPNCCINYLNIDELKNYDLWLAYYTTATESKYQYGQSMWQYAALGSAADVKAKNATQVGNVAGANGPCDVNWAYVGYAAKIKKLGMNTPVKYKVTGTKTITEDKLPEAQGQLKALGFSVTTETI